MFAQLIILAKLATLGVLKIKVYSNKDYGITISIDDVNNRVLSRDSNHIADVAMWKKVW